MTALKRKLTDLAVFGGRPAFKEALHVGRPNIGDRRRLSRRINEVLDRAWLTNNGPCVQEFERKLSSFLGVKHCIVTCNGAVALEIAIRATGMQGEVIVPSFTFVATAHALQWQKITPVFCDIGADTHNIDPRLIEKMITPRTTGIIGVHLWGRPCDADRMTAIARKRKLKLIFDAAHAFGCSYKGRMIGNFGDAEVLSFHATKVLNTFEGGAICTNDGELASKIRLMKNFGFSGYDNVIYIGTNGKMNEVSAAMGLSGLEDFKKFVAVNRANYRAYRAALKGVKGVKVTEHDASEKCNYHYVVLEIDENAMGLERDQLVQVLHAENVLARRYFHPGCHRMEPYRSLFPNASVLLPETEKLSRRVLALPTGTVIDAAKVRMIAGLIRFAGQNAASVRTKL